MSHDTPASVAFYCQRCGKIHVFDIPFLKNNNENILLCENCSHKIGSVKLSRNNEIIISAYCGVCKNENIFKYPIKNLKTESFEKLFCNNDNFEIGYIGRWESIAEFLDYTKAEYESLYPDDEEDFMDRQQILLEAVNLIHDLAQMRAIKCPCDNDKFKADIKEDSIVLKCENCQRYSIIPAKTSKDLERIQRRVPIKFMEK